MRRCDQETGQSPPLSICPHQRRHPEEHSDLCRKLRRRIFGYKQISEMRNFWKVSELSKSYRSRNVALRLRRRCDELLLDERPYGERMEDLAKNKISGAALYFRLNSEQLFNTFNILNNSSRILSFLFVFLLCYLRR